MVKKLKTKSFASVPAVGVDSPKQDRDVSPKRQRITDLVRGDRVVTAYNPAMALEMCERIADGATLRDICKPDGGFVTYWTFRRWCIEHPELMSAYREARTLSAIAFEDESIEMARNIRDDPGTAQDVRAFDVAMNHLRWVAARRNPQLFSEKAAIKLTVPIQINTNLDLGGKMTDQSPQADGNNTYTLEATVVEVVEQVDAKPLLEGGKSPRAPKQKKEKKGE